MRRFVAYATLAASMLVAVGVSVTPVLTQMQPGREFSTGREITFNVRTDDDSVLPSNALEEVSNEMRNRLDAFDFEDYSIKIENNVNTLDEETKKEGSITVSLSCEQDTFNNVCKYLTFSGRDISLTGKNEETVLTDIIDYNKVEIKQFNDLVPIVVIPLKEGKVSEVKDFIDKLGGTSDGGETANVRKMKAPLHADMHDDEHDHDHDSDSENVTPDLFLWGNYTEGDNYETAQRDALIGDRLIMSFASANVWYTKDDGADLNDDEDPNALKLVCGSMDEENESYDYGKLKNANFMATYYYNMLRASKYDYEITCPTRNVSNSTGIDYFSNSREVAPFAGEKHALFNYSNIMTLKFTMTVLSTLIVFTAIAVCFGIYFKLMTPAIIASSTGTLFLTFLLFSKLKALFNIPALIGGFIIFFSSIFVEVYHAHKLKEEVYKGRSIKKANQEASKKTNIIALDVSVVGAIAGLMTYLLGGVALKPMGVVLFFGSVISLLMNLITFKFLMYILGNSTYFQNKQRYFGINEEKIPNLMLEQKQSNTNLLEEIPYTKQRKVGGIVLGALSLLGLIGVMVFGIVNGSPLNIDRATQDTTVAYVAINVDDSPIDSETTFKSLALKDINKEGVSEEDYSLEMKQVNNEKIEGDSTISEVGYFFTVKINQKFDSEKLDDIKENINAAIFEVLPSDYTVSVFNSHELVYTPNQGLVALATGISLACVMVYFIIRYKPSRGIAATIVATASALSAYGILALTRIGTTAVSALAMPIIALTVLIATIPYLNLEKSMFKDVDGDITPEVKEEVMKKAISKSALLTIIFVIINLFATIIFFGLGMPLTTFLFASTLVGEIIGFAAIYIVLGPLANILSNWFAKIRLPKIKLFNKKNVIVQPKQKTSEPEETTFIGIND